MRDVFISGTGINQFGRYPERTVRDMTEYVVHCALEDSGLDVKEVGMAVFGNAVAGIMTGQEMIRGQVALRNTGLLGVPVINVENACGTGSTAFHVAWLAVASGQVEAAIAVGVEKMSHEDKQRAQQAISTGVEVHEGAPPFSFMELYARNTRNYMERSGATREDFAKVVEKSRFNGSNNPYAHFTDPTTVEDVLSARTIADPLTLPMCSPVSDGGAAVIVCSPELASRGVFRAVRIRASILVSGTDRDPDEPEAVEIATRMAYAQAGLGPDDLDVVELHDAAAPAELIDYELMGLCPAGGGPDLLRSGATSLRGRIPVNPGGGLLSRGHPIAATGIAQIVELADQLRRRAGSRQVKQARVGIAQNGGGWLGTDGAAALATILSRD
jgi:acetyl-CoA acetyltransferase